ncbi:hypothetical protein RJ640_014792 [Escallonia rubra]|uniref:Late embryogenesis abundant protein Lea5 n=1 Tax=Escallonia rubra TaxID=112253 RepID=A0AA88RI59_9ASTE|nr:hypothetical protein RJ640_014792 [Escallonia rubra]
MGRCSFKAKVVAASVLDGLSFTLNRRGYAAAATQGGAASGAHKGGATTQETVVIKDEPRASSSWGPDPMTGYYKPGDHVAEVDAAELRETFSNHTRSSPSEPND